MFVTRYDYPERAGGSNQDLLLEGANLTRRSDDTVFFPDTADPTYVRKCGEEGLSTVRRQNV